MNDPLQFLLADLAKLLGKYGPEPFQRLSDSLADPAFVSGMRNLFASLAQAAPHKSHRPRAAENHREIRQKLTSIKETAPETAELLIGLLDSLSVKRDLPSLQDIKLFAMQLGMTPIEAKHRNEAVVLFMEELASMPFEKIVGIVETLRRQRTSDPRAFENWARLILNEELRQKQGA